MGQRLKDKRLNRTRMNTDKIHGKPLQNLRV
jgi:hypothetical protein